MGVVLFVHGDSDGVVSGALAYRYFVERFRGGVSIDVVFSHPAGLHRDLVEFANPGDTVFIADIAISELHVDEIAGLFRKYSRRGELIYIDHHPEPLSISVRELEGTIVHDPCCSASELTYKYFIDTLGFEYSRVALYGAIGDYLDDTEWVKKTLHDWDKRSVYFEAGVLCQGLEASRKMYDFKRHVLKHLSENRLPSSLSELLVRALIESVNEEELRKWVIENIRKRNYIGYVVEPPGSLGRAANYARIYSGKPVGIAMSRHKNAYVMSLRAEKGLDLNTILRRITPRFHGTGGGHPYAAGAHIPVNYIEDFLYTLDREVETVLKAS